MCIWRVSNIIILTWLSVKCESIIILVQNVILADEAAIHHSCSVAVAYSYTIGGLQA